MPSGYSKQNAKVRFPQKKNRKLLAMIFWKNTIRAKEKSGLPDFSFGNHKADYPLLI